VRVVDEPTRVPVHYLWAVLIARIYEVFSLVCSLCAGQTRIIAFITYSAEEDTQIKPDGDLATHRHPTIR
jgi:hypothetical protein